MSVNSEEDFHDSATAISSGFNFTLGFNSLLHSERITKNHRRRAISSWPAIAGFLQRVIIVTAYFRYSEKLNGPPNSNLLSLWTDAVPRPHSNCLGSCEHQLINALSCDCSLLQLKLLNDMNVIWSHSAGVIAEASASP